MTPGHSSIREQELPNLRLLLAARSWEAAGSLRSPAASLMTRRSRSAIR